MDMNFGGSSDWHVTPVILSGGSGTRLWPLSRESFPKQMWPLVTEKSMIVETVLRSTGPRFSAPMVVCNREHRFLVAEQLRDAGVKDATIVVEPCARNSAPAIAAAAVLVAETDPDAVMWMMASDTVISDSACLTACLDDAMLAVLDDRIVVFGTTPTSPEIGFGYIEMGEAIAPDVFAVASFVEKPVAALAEKLVQGGKHLWNAGMFLFRARVLIDEMREHAPEVLAAARASVASRNDDQDFIRLDPAAFATSPNISLDFAVAERTTRAAVVKADFGWLDVGSWSGLWEISPKDSNSNVAVGDVLLEGVTNSYVRSEGIVTAVVGIDDAIVVTTDDAVLVMHKDRAQDVKRVVERLKAEGRREAASHRRTYRPWGFHERLIEGERFGVQRIVVKPGESLSLQMHYHRAEHWVVVAGTAIVTRGDDRILLRENESMYVPLGTVHRIENPGRIPLMLIEVQTGSYLGQDDFVRIDDAYGRALSGSQERSHAVAKLLPRGSERHMVRMQDGLLSVAD